jgi:hypothetical protein
VVIVEGFTVDGFLCVCHPHTTDVIQFEQAIVQDVLLRTLEA